MINHVEQSASASPGALRGRPRDKNEARHIYLVERMNDAVDDLENAATNSAFLSTDTSLREETSTAANPSTIFEAAAACRRIFRTATTAPRLMRQEWAENRLADFNLWSTNAGATSTGKASLDHRLRGTPEAQIILLNLLLMLRILVQKCIDGCMVFYHTRGDSSI
jgi:hypothetical protein